MTTNGESKSTLLFIHGGGISSWMWQPQVTALSEFACWTPDLPGHGTMQATPFSLDAAVAYLEDFMDARAATQPVHVVGLSVGGTVAIKLAQHRPQCIASLLLSSTSLGPLPGGRLMDLLTVVTLPLTRFSWVMKQSARSFGVPDALYPNFQRDMAHLTTPMYRRMNAVFDEFQPQDIPSLDGIRALVLAGAREAGFIRNNQRKIRDAVADATGYLVPGGGHTWNFELSDLFNQTVRAWVQNAPLPTALKPL